MFEGFRLDYVDVSEVSLRVRYGGAGAPVVLLHGQSRTHTTWHEVAPRLAEHHRVVTPDLRGYGGSTLPPDAPGHAPLTTMRDAHGSGPAWRPDPMLSDMTIQRMDNIGVVVDDLEAATAFFVELGMELEGPGADRGAFGGPCRGARRRPSRHCDDADPDGHGRLELTKFHTPTAVSAEPENAPANTLGIRRIMFAVEDIEDVLERLHTHGAELIGEVVQSEDSYRLCYVRGPEGIIVALAEQLS
jgi:catechol 2,3-dioxygenase-like lactoylglutathione lyase family enzyme